METISSILAVIIVVTTISNIVFKLRLKRIKKELHREQIINNLYNSMISRDTELVSIELLNSAPLDYLKQIKMTIIRYYSFRFNQLKHTDALMLGSHLWEVHKMLKVDRKEYLLNLLYKAAEPIRLELWTDLLVQAVILDNQLSEEEKLNDIAELIGFIITISHQENNSEEMCDLFEIKINNILDVAAFNRYWRNRIKMAAANICDSLNTKNSLKNEDNQ